MKKAVIAWGRMNPVTSGHEQLVNKVKAVARRERAEPHIYLSHTQSAKKDPLQYKDKIAMTKKAFGSIMKQSASRTLIQLMQELQRAGFTEITMVAGSDRVGEYKTLLNKYNGKDYTFDKIKVVSAGQRDPDAEGTAGMSATKLRQAAIDGDEKTFMGGVPSGLSTQDAKKLYKLVRKGLLVEEINRMLEEDIEDFTDAELQEFVDEYEEIEEFDEEDIEEALTLQQRIKKARIMKRLAPRLKRQRQIKKFRMAPTERLTQRARKMARQILRKKMAGKKGEQYNKLTASQKISIDKMIEKKASSIERIAKRLLPMVRKKEVERIRQARSHKSESLERFEIGFIALTEATKTPQDPDIKDKEGTQPKRYHTGLSKSTKSARDAHFKKGAKMDDDNPAAYKPAPGDATAKTKPSKYTKKYKELFGESKVKTIKVGEDAVTTSNPHYGLVIDRKIVAVGTKDEMLAACKEQGGRVWVTSKQVGDLVEQDAMDRARTRVKREKEASKRRHDRILDRARTQDARAGLRQASKTNRGVSSNVSEDYELTEKSMDALKKKAAKSGVSYGTLKKVYDRGVAAWRTGHRPGTTPQQWGYARVNAFITKKKAGNLNHDKDLANEHIPEGDGLWHNIHKKRREGRPMRKAHSKGAPTKQDFKNASENFQDGKNPQDKGDAARHGLKGKTLSQLKKIRSSETASKRKKQLAHWMINMHHNEETNLDESLQIEKGAGVGTFLTAADLGMKIKAGYADHPSIEEEGGAGEEGTDKLAKKYKKDTPEQ